MNLGENGETRVRGYLFILGRSLKSFLPRAVVVDALRELESHIRERIDQAEPQPNEQAALERVLAELGPPLRVAQAYSAEMTIEEAVTTGKIAPTATALWHLATTTILGFFSALGLLVGYMAGVAFLVMAALKPIIPNNVGLMVLDGIPRGFGVFEPLPAGAEVWGGYWIIPVLTALGLAALVLTHRGATRFLGWWRIRTRTRSDVEIPPEASTSGGGSHSA
jgi:uncharacterized membrane protein